VFSRAISKFFFLKDKGNGSLNSKLDELHKAATEAAFSTSTNSTASKGSYHTSGPPIPSTVGFAGFVEAFGKEIKKDLGMGT